MGSIPLPALAARAPEQQDPLETVGRYMQLKALQGQQQYAQQMRPLQMEEAKQLNEQRQMQNDAQRRLQQDQKLVGDYFSKNPGKNYADAANDLKGKISFQTTQGLTQADLAMTEHYQKMNETALKVQADQLSQYQKIYDYSKGLKPEEYAAQWPNIAQSILHVPGNQLKVDPAQPIPQEQLGQVGPLLQVAQGYQDRETARRESAAKASEAEQRQKFMQDYGTSTPTDQDKFVGNWLKTEGLENTPQNRLKGQEEYIKKTRIEPAQVRVEGYAATRGMNVTDTQTGVTAPMTWAEYAKASKAEPGRYVSPQYSGDVQMAVKAWKDLAPGGKTGTALTSYNQFLRHSGDLFDAVDGLKNSGYPYLNKGLNWLITQKGDPRVRTFLAKLDPVQKEFESFLLNNRALYSEDREAAQKIIDPNASPAQMYDSLKSIMHTGKARIDELNNSFERATGEQIPNMVSPEAAAAYGKVSGEAMGGSGGKKNTAPAKQYPGVRFTPVGQ